MVSRSGGFADASGGVGGMWVAWVWRDLRSHWVAVVAIGFVLAIGAGVYAGLGSTATWLRTSYDASFDELAIHDIRFELSPGIFAAEGELLAAVRSAGVGGGEVAERLVVDSQVDTTTATSGEGTLVVARLVGMNMSGSVGVDDLWVRDGSSKGGAVVEAKFADALGLDSTGSLLAAGGVEIEYSGTGVIPEDYYYEGPPGSLLSLGELAPIYLDLAELQEIAERPGQVNDVVVSLDANDPVQLAETADRIAAELDAMGLSYTRTVGDDEYAVRVLYDDIESDQKVFTMVSALILGAAALAAFNLINRIVESQRREIGIGMALGVDRRRLALRPMAVGVQVALVGVLGGIGVGYAIGGAMKGVFASFLPLPVYLTPFQTGVYLRAAVIAVALPLVAAAIPVRRALSVEPIQAIRLGHLAAKQSRLGDWTARLRLPGSTFAVMPVRNLVRTPRRTVLTALGVGAAVTTLVAVFGLLDSFNRTIELVGDELTGDQTERVVIGLDTFYSTSDSADSVVSAVVGADSVAVADPGLRFPAQVAALDDDGDSVALLVDLIDLSEGLWTPTIIEGDATTDVAGGGLVLARKAADDLGVEVGEKVSLTHPVASEGGFGLETSEIAVTAIHANPVRTFAYMPLSEAQRFGLAGLANLVYAYPPPGGTWVDVQRELFDQPGVASIQGMSRLGTSFDEYLEQFIGVLFIAAGAVLLLALLIAFNASRITVEERRREHATMQAFGLPARSVLFGVVKESILIGVLATIIGTAAGFGFLTWMVGSLVETTIPELSMGARLSPTTLITAAVVGVAAMAIAPLFLTRRLLEMNIPDTLRVME